MSNTQQPGKYIEVDPSVEIYYEERGTGSPIIFIPGWTFTTEVFSQQLEHFSQTHRVIVIDPRSHGRSTSTLQGNNYATHGTDLAKIIKSLELQNVVLIGWSFGCLTLWEYIRQAGIENIKATVCIDLSPKPLSTDEDDWIEGPLDEIGNAYNAYLQSPKGQRDFIEYYATEVMVPRDLNNDELLWIVAQSLNTPHHIAGNLFSSGMFSNYITETKQAAESIPTLYMIAEHWAETAQPFIQKYFPKTETEVMGGHMMFWEYPQKFNKRIDDFISSL